MISPLETFKLGQNETYIIKKLSPKRNNSGGRELQFIINELKNTLSH